MNPEILLVLAILLVVIGVLVTEIIPLEVLALLVLGTLAVTGLVSPIEALSGFSNPAVVTIWAVFILSGGLTRTGIANILGRQLLHFSGTSSVKMMIIIMTLSGVLSAFMNNVAVAALMMPVVMDLCRKTGHSPSLMLMPLAYGSLLGGLTTMIGTPPNILVSEALRANNLTPFGLFDFTPIGLLIMIPGILFIAFIGVRFLPATARKEATQPGKGYLSQYHMEERLFKIRIPSGSSLIGQNLSSSNLGSHFGLNVVGIVRKEKTRLAPPHTEIIRSGDELIVEGHPERILEFNNWGQLFAEYTASETFDIHAVGMTLARISLGNEGTFIGKTLSELNFRNDYRLNVLGIERHDSLLTAKIKSLPLQLEDILVVCGLRSVIEELVENHSLNCTYINDSGNDTFSPLSEMIRIFTIPEGSRLVGSTVSESRLGDFLDIQILNVIRKNGTILLPTSATRFEADDRLIISGVPELVASLLLQGLEAIFIKDTKPIESISMLEDDSNGLVEVIISPHSSLNGQTLESLRFREKYKLHALAVWRKGKPIRSGLRDLELQFGDVLLLFGSWKNLSILGKEPDFVVLTEHLQEAAREEKANTALIIMVAVLLPVIFGLVPIYIAVVLGAAIMVMSKCLTMEEAYRYIEWKAVFLIAGMLPLGVALESTGAAAMVAEKTVAVFGPFGPYGILFGLLAITFAATSIIPTAALVVLMVPIALQTATNLGISPYPLMMGIAMAASSSFTSPISHPANVLVMGPGGYRFMDYIKVGVPLTLLIFTLLMIFIPIFWPLQ